MPEQEAPGPGRSSSSGERLGHPRDAPGHRRSRATSPPPAYGPRMNSLSAVLLTAAIAAAILATSSGNEAGRSRPLGDARRTSARSATERPAHPLGGDRSAGKARSSRSRPRTAGSRPTPGSRRRRRAPMARSRPSSGPTSGRRCARSGTAPRARRSRSGSSRSCRSSSAGDGASRSASRARASSGTSGCTSRSAAAVEEDEVVPPHGHRELAGRPLRVHVGEVPRVGSARDAGARRPPRRAGQTVLPRGDSDTIRA